MILHALLLAFAIGMALGYLIRYWEDSDREGSDDVDE